MSINYDPIRQYQDTPTIPGEWNYEDADDELRPIAAYLKQITQHNEYISPERIKFLYSNKPRKVGGRYVAGYLVARNEVEKLVDDTYDFIAIVYYKAWKEFDIENKTIQLDKILSGIDTDTQKKTSPSVMEYIGNLRFFGAETVLNSSEVVDMTVSRIVDEEKEAKKNEKKALRHG